jgi:hypothetical protein
MNNSDDLPARDCGDGRPWERPGAVRRDCEPHRARLILALGGIAEFCGAFACFGAITAPLAITAGAAAWLLARHDLALMRQGLMDPAGRRYTEAGRAIGLSGAALGLGVGVLFLLMLAPGVLGVLASTIALVILGLLGLYVLLW